MSEDSVPHVHSPKDTLEPKEFNGLAQEAVERGDMGVSRCMVCGAFYVDDGHKPGCTVASEAAYAEFKRTHIPQEQVRPISEREQLKREIVAEVLAVLQAREDALMQLRERQDRRISESRELFDKP